MHRPASGVRFMRPSPGSPTTPSNGPSISRHRRPRRPRRGGRPGRRSSYRRARGAPSVAADLLERAAELDRIAPRRVEFLLEAADAAMAAGDADRAEDGLRAALGVVRPARPTGPDAARPRRHRLRPAAEHEALALLVDALDHTDGDPVLEALVHAHIAGMADMDPGRGYRSALAAVELLAGHEERAEPDQVACALLDRAFHWLLSGERLAVEDIDRGLALMRGTETRLSRAGRRRSRNAASFTSAGCARRSPSTRPRVAA